MVGEVIKIKQKFIKRNRYLANLNRNSQNLAEKVEQVVEKNLEICKIMYLVQWISTVVERQRWLSPQDLAK